MAPITFFQSICKKRWFFCWFGLPASGFLEEKPAKTSMLVPAMSNPTFKGANLAQNSPFQKESIKEYLKILI
ncbi:CLUMA_CG006649, isoform A [Clunio marinus]|uniref:CLUMA_CG006649, isoform A n=1 Tax=Clunio marinus TaxID=568069 RepID=A0A1J1HYF8_9DIPT|nr:CLUMA_CG006649, isoform A [Clunio marinus]